jgi:hypothetical protein
MTQGAGSEVVRVVESDEHYIVNWHTDETGTEVGHTYRLRVKVAQLVLGYADIQMAANGREARNITDDATIGLVDGRTLPVKFRIETGIAGSVKVTPLEATIDVGETQHFTAEVFDLHGSLLPGSTVDWWSSDPDVATVDGDGSGDGRGRRRG